VKVLNVHNHHALPGGMEVLFTSITRLLRERGHHVVTLERENAELKSFFSKIAAFGSAIHSPSAYRAMREMIDQHHPEVVHVHNLYPQLSVSALDACHDAGVPVVMSVQDYKLTCPAAQHLRSGKVCTKCVGGREHWCAIHNCRGSIAMSAAYAARNAYARMTGKVERAVSLYLCPTNFVAGTLIDAGYPADRVEVIPNFCDLPAASTRSEPGSYAAFIGRVSPEKGLDVLLDAACLSNVPTRVAGDLTKMPHLKTLAPDNVHFHGALSRQEIPDFLRGARFLVVPSIWNEAFGIVAAEAMSWSLPVIASRIGGLPEVVQDGVNGLLVEPGNAESLARAMLRLATDDQLCLQLGTAAREKATREYSVDAFYRRLMRAYARAADNRVRNRGFAAPSAV
jgi:glycosyltransferase involved in cell wall biosynthesis